MILLKESNKIIRFWVIVWSYWSLLDIWLDRATIRFRFYQPSSFNTALQLVLRPHFLVHFV
jgi:hypothetical protein